MNENTTDVFTALRETFHEEELHPDLVPYLSSEDDDWVLLRHPLVYSVPYVPPMNAVLNKQLEFKRKALLKAEAEGSWYTYVFLHERAYRAEALLSIAWQLGDEEYWQLVGHVWTDSENIRQNLAEWNELLDADRECREMTMEESERKAFEKLAVLLPVYRGYAHDDCARGASWTLQRETADWFARRFATLNDGTARVLVGACEKDDVIAHFTRRNEAEIVVLPQNVKVVRQEAL